MVPHLKASITENRFKRISLVLGIAILAIFAGCGTAPRTAPKPEPFKLSQDIILKTMNSVVKIETASGGTGSGALVVYEGRSYVVTNAHVLNFRLNSRGNDYEYDLPIIKTINGDGVSYGKFSNKTFLVRITHMPAFDIVVIPVKAEPFFSPALMSLGPIDDSLPRVGQPVFVWGAPNSMSLVPLDGTISGYPPKMRSVDGDIVEFIEAQISVQPGNSGGPMFSKDGLMIGVVRGRWINDQGFPMAITQAVSTRSFWSAFKRIGAHKLGHDDPDVPSTK